MPNNDLLKNLRAELLSPSLSLSYNDPIHVVRGKHNISSIKMVQNIWMELITYNMSVTATQE